MLIALGADTFFNEFHRMAQSDQHRQQLEQIMSGLVSEAGMAGAPGHVANPFATQAPNQQQM